MNDQFDDLWMLSGIQISALETALGPVHVANLLMKSKTSTTCGQLSSVLYFFFVK